MQLLKGLGFDPQHHQKKEMGEQEAQDILEFQRGVLGIHLGSLLFSLAGQVNSGQPHPSQSIEFLVLQGCWEGNKMILTAVILKRTCLHCPGSEILSRMLLDGGLGVQASIGRGKCFF